MSAGRPCRARRGGRCRSRCRPHDPPLTRKRPGLPGDAVPLEDLSRRVEQAVGACACGEAADRQRVEGAVVVAVEQGRVEGVAPGEEAAVGPARGLLPFELGGKPPAMPALGREPGRIGHGIAVRDHHHGMILPPRRRPAVRPRMAAGALVGVDQPIAAPGLRIDVGDAMARGGHERLVLGVGDQGARDEEAVERLGPARALAVVPAALPRPGVAIGRLVKPVGVLALGRIGARDEGAGGNLDHLRHDRAGGLCWAREQRAGGDETGDECGAEGDHRTSVAPRPPGAGVTKS